MTLLSSGWDTRLGLVELDTGSTGDPIEEAPTHARISNFVSHRSFRKLFQRRVSEFLNQLQKFSTIPSSSCLQLEVIDRLYCLVDTIT